MIAIKYTPSVVLLGACPQIPYNGSLTMDKNEKLQFPKTLLIPPVQQSPKNILNALYDDCLREIFKCSVLDIYDLCALASTCERFKAIGLVIFRLKYGQNYESIAQQLIVGANIFQWENFLIAFGEFIKSIDTTMCQAKKNLGIILHLIDKHCPNLVKLTCILYNRDDAVQLHSLFTRIHELHITPGTHLELGCLFAPNVDINLQHLTFNANAPLLSAITLPKLTSVHLMSFTVPTFFEQFFAMNPQLKKVQISPSDSFLACSHESILKGLVHLNQLEELALAGCWTAYNVFGPKKHRFYVRDWKLFSFLPTVKSLKLVATHLYDDQMVHIVKMMRNLTDIYIHSEMITLKGVKKFINRANPALKARFRVSVRRLGLSELRKNIKELKKIDAILEHRGTIKLTVDIPIELDTDDRPLMVSYFHTVFLFFGKNLIFFFL